MVVSSIIYSLLFPRGIVRRVICSTVSSGRPVSPPSPTKKLLVDTLYPIGCYIPYFILPSIFSTSSWCKRILNSDKIFHL